jgi:hypothetical protein
METSVWPVSRVFIWRPFSECSRFFQVRRNKLNEGSYGGSDGQLITLLLGFRVTSAEHQKGVCIVNVTDIIKASIGGYVDNRGGPYRLFTIHIL